jgi:hypothetical protein
MQTHGGEIEIGEIVAGCDKSQTSYRAPRGGSADHVRPATKAAQLEPAASISMRDGPAGFRAQGSLRRRVRHLCQTVSASGPLLFRLLSGIRLVGEA